MSKAKFVRSKNNSRFVQGYFTPKNPGKYVGDITKIRVMSSYELETHEFFDSNPNVLRWSSEPFAIPYIKPTDGKLHKYFPDYFVEYKNKDGEIVQEIIEVKPAAQTRRPRKNHKHKLFEELTFAINQAKWLAAIQFCGERGMKFRVLTERAIFK